MPPPALAVLTQVCETGLIALWHTRFHLAPISGQNIKWDCTLQHMPDSRRSQYHRVWKPQTRNNKSVLTYESLNKQCDGDNIKNKQIEYVLAILLQECGDAVPLSQQPVAGSILCWFNMKACHSETANKCYLLRILHTVRLVISSIMPVYQHAFSFKETWIKQGVGCPY